MTGSVPADTVEPGSPTGAPAAAPGGPAMQGPPPPPEMVVATGEEPAEINDCGTDNPAGLSDEEVQKLLSGGGGGEMRVLYPYDGTVFPRGMIAPLVMWDGAGMEAKAAYVHLHADGFDYQGCVPLDGPGQLQLSQLAWVAAGVHTGGAQSPFTLDISVLDGDQVAGPISMQLTIAKATLKGSIYYNSYSSQLVPGAAGAPGGADAGGFGAFFPGGGAGAPGGASGAVLRIHAGGTAEAFTYTTCNGCHSVSADGSRLISASVDLMGGGGFLGAGAGGGTFSYALTPDVGANPDSMMGGPKGAYSGLYPDGSFYLANSTAFNVARMQPLSQGPEESGLYGTDDGEPIAGTGIPTTALMPTFSPSGRLLTFNDLDVGNGGARGLAVMDFDNATKTASNYRELFVDSDLRPAWPFALPDDRAVVFARTASPEFSGDGAGLAPGARGNVTDLYVADIESGQVTMLARAMGFNTPEDAASDSTYLHFADEDIHANFFPTVSPVAAGGYFWVFFDSVRHYGNLGVQRQLWGAAVDVRPDGRYELDPSHPAFYLPGQEFGTGNHRAFAALDPCKMDGNTCRSGTDCCGGFCILPENVEFAEEQVGMCASEGVNECSLLDERCEVDEDCCPSENGDEIRCIANYCAILLF